MTRRWIYDNCEVLKVVDGDTIDVKINFTIDVGFSVEAAASTVQRIRFAHINAPETNRKAEKKAGLASKAWLSERIQPGDIVTIETYKGDAFGRYIADVYPGSPPAHEVDNIESINHQMVAAGHAVYKTY